MKIDEILETYDNTYASEYNTTFIHADWNINSINFQLNELKNILDNHKSWLDIACGTGFVLSQFEGIEKTGIDISPSMLKRAKEQNPDTTFHEANFLDEHSEWESKWEVVSCMWWAYCMVESITDIRKLIRNMSNWVTEDGVCFLPLCNPQKFDTNTIKIPYIDKNVPGDIRITSIVWSWKQENGKRHDNVVSPLVDHMVILFEEFFDDVAIIEGDINAIGEGWRVQDILVARGKKNKKDLDLLINW